MTGKPRTPLVGIMLIVIGVVFLLPEVTPLRGRDVWPLVMVGMGLSFIVMFLLDRSTHGYLMAGSILTIIGLMFGAIRFGIGSMSTLWPLLLIAPGIGFLLTHVFGRREKGLLTASLILNTLGVLFLFLGSTYSYLWPALLIIAGLIILFSGRVKKAG